MQLVPPPVTLAVLVTEVETPLPAMLTCALITGASEPGSNTPSNVQFNCVAVLLVQTQPTPTTLSATGVLMVMPAGIASVTVIRPLVLLVPALPAVIE